MARAPVGTAPPSRICPNSISDYYALAFVRGFLDVILTLRKQILPEGIKEIRDRAHPLLLEQSSSRALGAHLGVPQLLCVQYPPCIRGSDSGLRAFFDRGILRRAEKSLYSTRCLQGPGRVVGLAFAGSTWTLAFFLLALRPPPPLLYCRSAVAPAPLL